MNSPRENKIELCFITSDIQDCEPFIIRSWWLHVGNTSLTWATGNVF